MHTNLLTAQSSTLEATITAGRTPDLQSWNSDTVGHLVNFLYLGTYDVPHPEPHSVPEASSDSPTTATNSRVHTPDTEHDEEQDYTTDSQPSTPVSAVCVTDIDCDSAPAVAEGDYHVLYPLETHNYHNVLLAHVRVYALAQSLSIDRLCRLAYRRLSLILSDLKPIATRSALATSVVELLRYVYTDVKPRADPMRRLVAQFVAQNFLVLRRTVALEVLVRGGGDLAADLMWQVSKRLLAK